MLHFILSVNTATETNTKSYCRLHVCVSGVLLHWEELAYSAPPETDM